MSGCGTALRLKAEYTLGENAAVEGLKCKGGGGVWCGGSEVNAERGLGQYLPSKRFFFLAMSHEAWPHNTAQHNKQNATRKEISKGQAA
jgi:hypothetical protein